MLMTPLVLLQLLNIHGLIEEEKPNSKPYNRKVVVKDKKEKIEKKEKFRLVELNPSFKKGDIILMSESIQYIDGYDFMTECIEMPETVSQESILKLKKEFLEFRYKLNSITVEIIQGHLEPSSKLKYSFVESVFETCDKLNSVYRKININSGHYKYIQEAKDIFNNSKRLHIENEEWYGKDKDSIGKYDWIRITDLIHEYFLRVNREIEFTSIN